MAVGAVLICAPARAASFRVNTPADLADAAPGDGVCEANRGAGDCSLRAAIEETSSLPGADDILVAPDTYSLTIIGPDEDAGATGDLDIQGEVNITCEAPGPCKVSSNPTDRCLHIRPGSLVVIEGIAFSGGSANPGAAPSSEMGGLVLLEGATATVSQTTLTSGTARFGGAIAAIDASILQLSAASISSCVASSGGGVWSADSSVFLLDAQLDGCFAQGAGGGLAFERSSVGVGACTISANFAARGGGLAALAGSSATIEGSVIAGNTGFLQGGGASVDDGQIGFSGTRVEGNSAPDGAGIAISAGTLDVFKSSVTSNPAVRGGGVFVSGGRLRCVNSTLALNKATGAPNSAGGAILLADASASAALSFTTVSGNTALGGGGLSVEAGLVTLANSIVSGNTADTAPDASAADGLLVSRGFNIIGDGAGLPPSGVAPEDRVGIDPLLSALTPGRGFSLGMPLGNSSPAVDRADPTGCMDPDGGILTNDQHGEARPIDGDGDGDARCDIGALESCGEDLDGDGVGDKCGCQPGDLGSIIVPPEPLVLAWRISGFRHALLTWTDLTGIAGTRTTYEVAGESIDDIWRDRGVDGPCLITGLVDERFEDVRPAAEDMYYLVRGVNACGPAATQGWGKDSLGNPRLACP